VPGVVRPDAAGHRSHLFDLTIATPFPCPAWPPGRGRIDVGVREGRAPALVRSRRIGPFCQVAPGRARLDVAGVATFTIEGGGRITVERHPGADDDLVRLLLSGTPLGLALAQRGVLVLHASVVVDARGRAIALAGGPADGKSVLAAALVERGYRLLSDDLCCLRVCGDGRALALPGAAQLVLGAAAASRVCDPGAERRRVHPDLERVAVGRGDRYHAVPAPLAAVVLLRPDWGGAPAVEELRGADKVLHLDRAIFRRTLRNGMGLQVDDHRQLTALAPRITLTELRFPPRWERLDETADRVEAVGHDTALAVVG
jgi:hypothetical protein